MKCWIKNLYFYHFDFPHQQINKAMVMLNNIVDDYNSEIYTAIIIPPHKLNISGYYTLEDFIKNININKVL